MPGDVTTQSGLALLKGRRIMEVVDQPTSRTIEPYIFEKENITVAVYALSWTKGLFLMENRILNFKHQLS